MAHTIVGIDLGASAVKFVLLDAGLRRTRFAGRFEEPIAPGEAPLPERQLEAVRAGVARLPPESTLYVAVPGELLAVRVLDLPFSDPRKVEQVVGYELEGQIVHALQDVVFDHAVLKQPRPEGAAVLAAAARTDELGQLLAGLSAAGVDPRGLFAAPVVYRALFPAARAAADAEPACELLIDIGERRTNLCFLSAGETIYARTLLRGGGVLTAAIARAFNYDLPGAEQAKREHGFVASTHRPVGTRAQERMDQVLRPALAPLLRDARQTLASFSARDKTPISRILLAGGGAALTGLAEHLEQELEIPVARWSSPNDIGPVASVPPLEEDATAVTPVEGEGEDGTAEGRFALASAIAWAGARGGKELDLRRGPYVYRASFSVLRQRALHLVGLAAAVVLCASIDATMALGRLTSQKEQLQAQLKSATTELFGEPRMDAKAVAALLKRGFREEMAPLPKATAFDLLDQISRKMPSSERIKLDIHELDIRPKKTFIKGTVDSAAAVDEIVAKMKEIECFEEITKGAIQEVSGAKQFTLTIATTCP